MNITLNIKFDKLNDLCDQIFDYFQLAYYDLESKINNELIIDNITNKFETFADKHFKSAINDFEIELQKLKNHFPKELIKLENLTYQITNQFEVLVNNNTFDFDSIRVFKSKIRGNLNRIKNLK